MEDLETISGAEVMNLAIKPTEFYVDGLLPPGLFVLAGAPKVGKSWLALDICLSVAKGEKVLNATTIQGSTLYLCLEDKLSRIQERQYEMTDESSPYLFFSLLAKTIGGGLIEQLERFVSVHPDTKVIFIDTLQKVRDLSYDSGYANDYQELSLLKAFADSRSVAVVLVHHLRKAHDADPFMMISGTTGISGCVDGSFVLVETKRGDHQATLYCVGRDIENRELEIYFNKNLSRLVNDEELNSRNAERIKFAETILIFMKTQRSFTGTPTLLTELLSPFFEQKIYPNRLTRDLVQNSELLAERGVAFENRRDSGGRIITLKLKENVETQLALCR